MTGRQVEHRKKKLDPLRKMEQIKGSISVFLICILIPMTVFQGLLIDASKLVTAKTMASNAGSMAMNGALADYNTTIANVYGLFAMSADESELSENVSKYFNETLSSSNLDLTRVPLTDAGNVSDASSYSTFMNMKANVTAKYAENSSLENTEITKSEILQYMKYRAPASLSYGLLSKFKAFTALSKQKKAVDAKLDYDKELNEVQKKLQAAYDAIDEYLTISDTLSSEYNNLDKIKTDYQKVSGCLAEYKVLENKNYDTGSPPESSVKEVTAGSDPKSEISPYIIDYAESVGKIRCFLGTKKDGTLKSGQNMRYYSELINKAEEDGEYAKLDAIDKMYKKWDSTVDKSDIKYSKYFSIFYVNDQEYQKNNPSGADYENEVKIRKELQKYDVSKIVQNYQNSLSTKGIQNSAKDAYQILSTADSDFIKASAALENASEKMQEAKDEEAKLSSLKETWKNAVNDLPQGEMKNSSQVEVDSRTENLDDEKFNALKTIIDNGKTACDTDKKYIENISYNDTKLYNFDSNDYFSNYQNILSGLNYSYDKLNSTAFSKLSYGGNEKTAVTSSDTIKGDEFYKYLSGICKSKDKKKESAEKDKKNSVFKSSLDDVKVDDGISGSFTENAASGDADIEVGDSGTSDDKLCDNAKNVMNSGTSMFDALTDMLTAGRNKLYIEEYATEMFSCYVSGKGDKDNAISDESLSGNSFVDGEIPSVNHQAEVEYLLYGKNSAKENVETARNYLFTVRFLLNLIYAFTGDPEIKAETLAEATIIAGWTGFGIPIVQNVLIIA